MSDDKLEAFSALLDGEADAAEHKPLLHALAEDAAARNKLARYRMIGDGMRGEPLHTDALQVADAVRQRLQREPVVLAPPQRPRRTGLRLPRWWQPAAGLAIAASVALLAVGLVPRLLSDAPDATPATVQVVGVPVASPVFVSSSVPQWSPAPSEQPSQQSRLSSYLADHSEVASQTGIPGIVPYASFVSYDGKE